MIGHELDIEQPERLAAYLRRLGKIGANEQVSSVVLNGGVSNRTVLVQRPSGEQWVLKQALRKLRVSSDWFSSPERIHREACGLRWLPELAPPGTITPLIFEDAEQHVLAMRAVPQPHDNWKTLLLAGRLQLAHVTQFAKLLGTIHRTAFEQRDRVAPAFADRSFFESLRIEPYYSYTATQLPPARAFYSTLIDTTRACRLTLVHGDYSPKNILVYQDRLVLLDHEVIHFGDPAFDLGFSLTHLLSKAHHLPAQRATFAAAAHHYWQVYQPMVGDLAWSRELEARAVCHTLGCLLARVAGRSPLEYLGTVARLRQQQVAIALMERLPVTIDALIDEFILKLESTGAD